MNSVNGSRSAGTPCARRCAGCGRTISSRRARAPAPWSSRGRRRTPMSRTSCRSTTCSPSRRAPSSRSSRSRWSPSTGSWPLEPVCPSARNGLRWWGSGSADDSDTPICRTEYYINRSFAAVGRMLQNHTGPIFPLLEDLFGISIVEVRQEIAAVQISPELAASLKVAPGTPGVADAADVHHLGLGDRPGHREHPSVVPVPPFDDDATGEGLSRCAHGVNGFPASRRGLRQRAVGRRHTRGLAAAGRRGDTRTGRSSSTGRPGWTAAPCTIARPHWPPRCWRASRSAAWCPSCCPTGTRPPSSTTPRRWPAWWSTPSCRRCATTN